MSLGIYKRFCVTHSYLRAEECASGLVYRSLCIYVWLYMCINVLHDTFVPQSGGVRIRSLFPTQSTN